VNPHSVPDVSLSTVRLRICDWMSHSFPRARKEFRSIAVICFLFRCLKHTANWQAIQIR
jgi:hypothetical protein